MPFPEDLNALYKIVKDTEPKKRKGDKDREKDKEKERDREGEDPYVLECSAKLAIAPLEKICELMQLLSSYAMELPSCGFRYGLAIAGNSNYMKVRALISFIIYYSSNIKKSYLVGIVIMLGGLGFLQLRLDTTLVAIVILPSCPPLASP